MVKKDKKTGGKNYMLLPPKRMKAHPLNEKYFGENKSRYNELLASIEANGFLLQYPITCVKSDNLYVILCGHRRWKAACELNLLDIPVIILPDITADSVDAERIMIEDNLHRPLQWRNLSDLERYMLALKLKELYTKKRGGDRRSERFLTSKHEEANSDLAIDEISKVIGMSKRYMSMLSVITYNSLKDIMESSPDLFDGQTVYDQIKTAIDNNLSEDLTALARAKVPVYKAYERYKKGNKPQTLTSQGGIQATDNQNERDIPFNNVVASLLKYFESRFDDREVFSEAAELLSATPEGNTKQLKLFLKALNNVKQKMQEIKARCKKKCAVEPELFLEEE